MQLSVMNIVWSPGRVLVAVDTLVHAPLPVPGQTNDVLEAHKMLHLPAAGAVIACRGNGGLLPYVVLDLLMKGIGRPATVDTLARLLPDAAAIGHRFCLEAAARSGASAHAVHAYEVALAGWSPTMGRMLVQVVYLSGLGAKQQLCELGAGLPVWLVPSWDDTPEPDPMTAEQLLNVARRQVARTRELGEAGFGGRLICADLTQERVDVRELGVL